MKIDIYCHIYDVCQIVWILKKKNMSSENLLLLRWQLSSILLLLLEVVYSAKEQVPGGRELRSAILMQTCRNSRYVWDPFIGGGGVFYKIFEKINFCF